MDGVFFDVSSEARTIEVRVFRHGRLIHDELCESEEQAALVVDAWSEMEGVECQVRDLSQRPAEASETNGNGPEMPEEDYPEAMEVERDRQDASRRGD